MKGEIDKPIITVGDFNSSLSVVNRSRRQEISKNIVELKYAINQHALIDIYRILHPTTAENTLF